MSIAIKDRFAHTNLRLLISGDDVFPPETFTYLEEEYIGLGRSNKDFLIPVNVTDIELQRIVTSGGLAEFVYSDVAGNLYEVCLYRGADGKQVYLYAIGTREKPEKQKEVKEEKTV